MRRRRIELAEMAARLLLNGEARDWQGARRKVLAKHGPVDLPDQPDAADIDAAMSNRLRLFSSLRVQQVLERKRRAALEAMRVLHDFEPRLSGPVLGGTAVEASPIELHVFADRCEDVSVFLDDRRIPHELRDIALTLRDGRKQRFPAFLFQAGEDSFEVIVFASVDLKRPAPFEPGAARPMARADRGAVSRLLEVA